MRILIAPDSFKGTLTAAQAAAAIAAGVRRALPDAELHELPMADGGEGTVEAVVAAGGIRHHDVVSGPLGEPVAAEWAMLGTTAVIEMAQASGLHLVDPTPGTALAADTFGTGELMRLALDAGATELVVGIGGSATTDAGLGALRALGLRALDADGMEIAGQTGGGVLGQIETVDLTGIDPRLAGTRILLCSDVANPFAGPGGAAEVFAPQKGADVETVAELDAGLGWFAGVLAAVTGVDLVALGWGGAGGGIAGGLRAVLGAETGIGVDLVAELLDLDAALAATDLVIVGEGSIDDQTRLGKAPIGVARRARAVGVPAIAVAGRTTLASDALEGVGIRSITPAAALAPTPAASLAEPARWLEAAAEHALREFLAHPHPLGE